MEDDPQRGGAPGERGSADRGSARPAARQGVAPRAEPFFRRKIDFGDEVVTLELGIAAEPVGVYSNGPGSELS